MRIDELDFAFPGFLVSQCQVPKYEQNRSPISLIDFILIIQKQSQICNVF